MWTKCLLAPQGALCARQAGQFFTFHRVYAAKPKQLLQISITQYLQLSAIFARFSSKLFELIKFCQVNEIRGALERKMVKVGILPNKRGRGSHQIQNCFQNYKTKPKHKIGFCPNLLWGKPVSTKSQLLLFLIALSWKMRDRGNLLLMKREL